LTLRVAHGHKRRLVKRALARNVRFIEFTCSSKAQGIKQAINPGRRIEYKPGALAAG
jgi:hypothetical protein